MQRALSLRLSLSIRRVCDSDSRRTYFNSHEIAILRQLLASHAARSHSLTTRHDCVSVITLRRVVVCVTRALRVRAAREYSLVKQSRRVVYCAHSAVVHVFTRVRRDSTSCRDATRCYAAIQRHSCSRDKRSRVAHSLSSRVRCAHAACYSIQRCASVNSNVTSLALQVVAPSTYAYELSLTHSC